MTKAELKDIIKECILENNAPDVTKTINEDTEIVLIEEELTFDDFDSIMESVDMFLEDGESTDDTGAKQVQSIREKILNAIDGLLGKLQNKLSNAQDNSIKSKINGWISNLRSMISNAKSAQKVDAFKSISDHLKNMKEDIQEFFSKVKTDVTDKAKEIKDNLKNKETANA